MGLARRIPAGADLVLRSHFHPSGKAEVERTVLGLHFAAEPPSRTLVNLQLPPLFGALAGIDVPAGETLTVADSFRLPVDVQALTVGGHAHLICREMQVHVTPPGGERRSIFLIDDWDFDWQNRYAYAEPLELPAGTLVEARLTYDNTAVNPNNPYDPPRPIRWGRETTDEMGSITLLLVAGDEGDTPALQRAVGAHLRAAVFEGLGERGGRGLGGFLRRLDRNGDGRIEPGEHGGELSVLAGRIDRDGDGVLSREEVDTFLERAAALARLLGVTRRDEAPPEPTEPAERDPLDASGARANVLFFISQDCPIANAYAPEIQTIAREHARDPLRFYLVHVDPDLSPEGAADHAREYGYALPTVLDGGHELVRSTGVTRTPEVAVVLPGGELAYRGRIDDLYGDVGRKRPAPSHRDLRDALRAVLAGEPVPVERTPAVGCTIPELPVPGGE